MSEEIKENADKRTNWAVSLMGAKNDGWDYKTQMGLYIYKAHSEAEALGLAHLEATNSKNWDGYTLKFLVADCRQTWNA